MNDENEEKNDDQCRVLHIKVIGPNCCCCYNPYMLKSCRRSDRRSASILCGRDFGSIPASDRSSNKVL